MDIEDFLRYRGGSARTASLQIAGFPRPRLDKELAAGRIVRVRRGVYGLPNHTGAVRLALQHNALLTCVSAAPVYQLWTLQKPALVHLSPGHKRSVPGTVTHGRTRLQVHPSGPVAGLADVLIHALHCCPTLEALVMVQCAAQRGDVTLDFLRSKLPGNRNGRARAVLDFVIPRADSILEVLADYHFRQAGLSVCRHVELDGVGEVDFLVEDCLVVETDGQNHLEPKQVRKDRVRNNATVVGGRLCLRFSYADVVHHPGRMVAQVLAVLEHARRGTFSAT